MAEFGYDCQCDNENGFIEDTMAFSINTYGCLQGWCAHENVDNQEIANGSDNPEQSHENSNSIHNQWMLWREFTPMVI